MKILTMRKRLANRKRASKPVILMKNRVILATTEEQHEVVAIIVANAKQDNNIIGEPTYENTERDTSLITERKKHYKQLRDMATLRQGETLRFDANNKNADKSTGYYRDSNRASTNTYQQRGAKNNSSLCDESTCCNSNTRQVVNTTSD